MESVSLCNCNSRIHYINVNQWQRKRNTIQRCKRDCITDSNSVTITDSTGLKQHSIVKWNTDCNVIIQQVSLCNCNSRDHCINDN